MMSLPSRRTTSGTDFSSPSAAKKSWPDRRYSLGFFRQSGASTLRFAHSSSMRSIQNGSHEHPASMKPIRRLGYFSGTPSKIMPVSWIICATGCESVCTSTNLSKPSARKQCGRLQARAHGQELLGDEVVVRAAEGDREVGLADPADGEPAGGIEDRR